MLDHFLQIAYKNDKARETSVKLAHSLKDLPLDQLRRIALGQEKLSFGCDGEDWLEKFKGTPLFQEALVLERSMLEAEVATDQAQDAKRQQREALEAQIGGSDQFYATQEQIRMQKKMLDLKLVELQAQETGAAPTATGAPMPSDGGAQTQGAGAMGDVPDTGGPAAKTVQASVAGQRLLKAAAALAVPPGLASAGSSLGSILGGAARKAVNYAKKNPVAAGAAVGTVGGAVAGGPDHRISGALSGATLGAGAAHAASGIHSHMAAGQTLGQAAKSYGAGVKQQLSNMDLGRSADLKAIQAKSSVSPVVQGGVSVPTARALDKGTMNQLAELRTMGQNPVGGPAASSGSLNPVKIGSVKEKFARAFANMGR